MSAAPKVTTQQRYTHGRACPICGGSGNDKRGQGVRCIGFLSEDGEWAQCSREEHAGQSPFNSKTGCYSHKLKGECKCGRSHGLPSIVPYTNGATRPSARRSTGVKRDIECTYDYRDGTGLDLIFQEVRLRPKGFTQRRPDPNRPNEWKYDLNDVKLVLYNLSELVAADLSKLVWVVEGPKDVETLKQHGLLATCNPMGAGKWKPEYSQTLRNRHLILCGDNDYTGRQHIQQVAQACRETAASLCVLDLAALMKKNGLGELPEKGDVSDFFAMGKTLDQLLKLVDQGVDPFRPTYATLADALALIGDTRWVWERWIPAGCMSLLAAVGGGGKTRTAMDLARRLWLGLPFPDGGPNPLPPGTKTLWLMFDRNWAESGDVAKNFGIPPEAILLPSLKASPLDNPDFDDPKTIEALAKQVEEQKPGLIVIDTITYATSRNTSKAEEAKAAFDGIMQLAATTGVAVLALTHLNKEGEVLGRRITERARSVLSLSLPDPDGQPNRRKLWVSKTAVKTPEALGITFTDASNDYDGNPPSDPQVPGKARGPAPAKSTKMAEWLLDQLSRSDQTVKALVDAAQFDGFLAKPTAEKPKISLSPLYNAKDRIPTLKPGCLIEEAHDNSGRKVWRLVDDSDSQIGFDTTLPVARPIPSDFKPTDCSRCKRPLVEGRYHATWEHGKPVAECWTCNERLGS